MDFNGFLLDLLIDHQIDHQNDHRQNDHPINDHLINDHPINDHPINDHPILIEIEIEIEIDHPIDHLKMNPLGPMEARPTCSSTLFSNYFQDLENDPRCNFDESESIFSRNGPASHFIKKNAPGTHPMGPKWGVPWGPNNGP